MLEEAKEYLEGDTEKEGEEISPTSPIIIMDSSSLYLIRQKIQSLSRCANPFSQELDSLMQEDVIFLMLTEKRTWEEEYRQNQNHNNTLHLSLDHHQQDRRHSIEVLSTHLNELTDSIDQMKEVIERKETKLRQLMNALVVPKSTIQQIQIQSNNKNDQRRRHPSPSSTSSSSSVCFSSSSPLPPSKEGSRRIRMVVGDKSRKLEKRKEESC